MLDAPYHWSIFPYIVEYKATVTKLSPILENLSQIIKILVISLQF
jgi:hypothetical protein